MLHVQHIPIQNKGCYKEDEVFLLSPKLQHVCLCLIQNPSRRLSHGQITGYQLTISQIHSEAVQTGSSAVKPASHNSLPQDVTGIVGYREADIRVLKVLNETGRRSYNVVGDKMLKNESYLLEVRAGTEKGFSDAVSGVVIQPWNKGIYVIYCLKYLYIICSPQW